MEARFVVIRASVSFALCGSEAKERMVGGGPRVSGLGREEEKKMRRRRVWGRRGEAGVSNPVPV